MIQVVVEVEVIVNKIEIIKEKEKETVKKDIEREKNLINQCVEVRYFH